MGVTLIIIFAVLAVILILITVVIAVKSRQDEVQNYYNAAQNILKEQQLDLMLKNPYNGGHTGNTGGLKTMIYLKHKHSNDCKYVFNLDEEIHIGRDKDANQLCVNEAIVSHNHCKIYVDGGAVCICDLNSANGLEVKRGMHHYYLVNGQYMELMTKDVIKVGTTEFLVEIFYFDSAVM